MFMAVVAPGAAGAAQRSESGIILPRACTRAPVTIADQARCFQILMDKADRAVQTTAQIVPSGDLITLITQADEDIVGLLFIPGITAACNRAPGLMDDAHDILAKLRARDDIARLPALDSLTAIFRTALEASASCASHSSLALGLREPVDMPTVHRFVHNVRRLRAIAESVVAPAVAQ